MDADLRNSCRSLLDRIVQLRDSLDYDTKKSRIAEIDATMAAANFWDRAEQAQATVAELSRLRTALKPVEQLSSEADDLEVLMEFAEEDETGESRIELQQAVDRLEKELDQAELQASMRSPEDSGDAYLTVQAGEGGTDAADFAEMLERMYLRWCEERGYKAEVMDRSDGEEGGIRNSTLHIKGPYAFGYLKGETGNHRLVRISPFDSAGRRHTSFAAVDVIPDLGEDAEIEVDWAKDVREETMRAGGAGGQHVNKTESAIRLTHLPSGVVVQCQNERSQHKNRATARKMLLAKLYQIQQEKQDAEIAARRGEKSKIGFGGQTIRHYVLQPQQFVKDDRMDLKLSNPFEVLDGAIDPLLEAYLRWSIAK
ncbi:MAG: peptide chain release factor 2 [Planctomycetaceae bacterium]|nr:peptide chain release factor 2 [Planctomycetaceae bacterium]